MTTIIIRKTVFVGGPAHGQVGNDIVADKKGIVNIVDAQSDSLVMTGQGIRHSEAPYQTHTYKVRKMALSKAFGKRKIYELLIHEELWDDVRDDMNGQLEAHGYRRLMDAVLDAMFKAFL